MKKDSSFFYYFYLAFFSPLLAFYAVLQETSWKLRKSVLILLATIFGSTIVLNTSDGYVLQQMIYDHYVDLSFAQWLYGLKQILLFSPEYGTKGDVFNHTISYIFGSVIGLPSLYFVLVSFIYSYFYINSLAKILDRKSFTHKNLLFWLFIIIFITYRGLDSMQSVRTWTGGWVLFYATFSYYQTKNKKYLFLMLSAPLFHVAYFLMAIPVYLVVLFHKFDSRYFILIYILSFFININQGVAIDNLSRTDVGEDKVAGYYRDDPDDYENALDANNNFYKKYGKGWSLYFSPHFMICMLIFMGFYGRSKLNYIERSLFITGMMLAALANFGSFIPVLYHRTSVNAGLYITALSALLMIRGAFMTSNRVVLRQFNLWLIVLCFAPYLFYVLANYIQFTSVFMVFFPVFGMFNELNFSIRDLLGLII